MRVYGVRFFVITVLMIINFAASGTILFGIRILGIVPNLGLAFVVSYAILRGDVRGCIVGFFVGLIQDIFYGRYLGFYALTYSLTGFFCGKPFRDFYLENYLFPVVLTAAGSLLNNVLFYVFNFLLRARVDFGYYFTKVILPEAIYTTIVSLLYYKILYSLNKRLEDYERKKRRMFEET